MTISDIRLKNLQFLIDAKFDGNKAAIADKAGKDRSSITRFFADENKSHARVIGNDMARDLERAGGMPDGWMDIDHSVTITRVDTELLAQIIEAVKDQSANIPNFSNKEFAESVARVYGETIDEPADARNTSFFDKLITKITRVVINTGSR